jgi:hypothetical protein
MRCVKALCCALVTLLAGWAPLYSQTIIGELEDEAGTPVAGALLTLLDEQSVELDDYLSDSAGAFLLTAPVPGQYRIRVERIGQLTLLTPILELAAGDSLVYRIEVPAQPVDLAGLGPAEEPECVSDLESAFATSRLWQEIRKALVMAAWTGEWVPLRLELARYLRDLDLETRRVGMLDADSWLQSGARTLASLPASELVADGYVRDESGEGDVYWAPDPQVLLSQAFRETHCYSVRLGRGPEGDVWVGLAFEPIAERELPDLKGVLWVDRATAELRRLEFWYTSLPRAVAAVEPGGWIDFWRLPTGEWIVGRWQISLPVVAGAEEAEAVGMREVGVEVAAVYGPEGALLAEEPPTALIGTVVDRAGGSPVADAHVFLTGTGYADTTDARGRFRIEGVLPGSYGATVTDPALEELGIASELRTVEVRRGSATEVQLALPQSADEVAAVCPGQPGDVVALAGVVRDSASGVPVPGARVAARWSETLRVRADETGRFRFCRLPPDIQLTLEAEALGHTGHGVTIRSPGLGRFLRRDLLVTLVSEGSIVTRVVESGASGPTRLVGRVLDAQSLEPIDAVNVRIEALGLQRLTDSEGHFAFPLVDPGSHELALEHLAYGTRADTIVVTGGELINVEVRMAMRPIELEPLTVIVERRPLPPKMHGFYSRMDRGWGDFITREALEDRQPVRISQMIGDLPGARLIQVAPGQYTPIFRHQVRFMDGRNLSPCPPALYVDGILILDGASHIDEFVLPYEVEAVEVYKSAASVPARFGGSTAGCGVIVIWSRGG